ncbi:amidohydrolase family protein [Haloarculaceae archaeon H-GB2-1]|nr:amidohydrolase family protein [Haloarculaceae archaeon H-GB1-1]MEA5387982.1 amidohydrolase family protein [Haloarculaceae archaeon H-GB11]MEA5409473.1 amidohydrolase family protein [Haloarculaceae archaeon H-GB2-1]
MADFCITDARTLDGRSVDVVIRDGVVARVADAGEADPAAFDADQRFDADGRLVTPSLTEIHTHLDASLTAGLHRWNESGTVVESREIWDEMRDSLTKAGIKERARKTVDWFVANGVTRIRTHVGVANPTAVEALVELREELADLVDVQLVAFVYDFVGDDESEALLRDAIDRGADVVGGMPHGEPTRERGVEHVETVVDLADRNDLPLDLHIDETDDPNSRYTEVLAAEAMDRGIGDRTNASHATAMHSYSDQYADDLCRLLANSGVSVVTNPPVNAVLQGRFDGYPRRRGLTRVDELLDHGVTVGVGQDDVVDTAYAYGDGDPLDALAVLMRFAHMNGREDVARLWSLLVDGNAAIYGLDESSYGLREGAEGSVVVYDAPDGYNAFRRRAPRSLVLKDGVPVARTERTTTVGVGDDDHVVDFDCRFE